MRVRGPRRDSSAQLIDNLLCTPDGAPYLAADAVGPASFLWAGDDCGAPGATGAAALAARTRSSPCCAKAACRGWAARAARSRATCPNPLLSEGGKSWAVSKSPFAAVGSKEQRPALIRPAGERPFFAGDRQDDAGRRAWGAPYRGAFVALLKDEGRTWPLTNPPSVRAPGRWALRERPGWPEDPMYDPTLGYPAAAQAPDGLIHLISS